MSVKTLNFQKLVACIIFGAVVLALPMSWHYFSVRAYKENLVAKEAAQQRQREFATQQALELYKQKAEFNKMQREIAKWNAAKATLEEFCARHPKETNWAKAVAED
jgi:biopolymer transport protein ExbB/TolQ